MSMVTSVVMFSNRQYRTFERSIVEAVIVPRYPLPSYSKSLGLTLVNRHFCSARFLLFLNDYVNITRQMKVKLTNILGDIDLHLPEAMCTLSSMNKKVRATKKYPFNHRGFSRCYDYIIDKKLKKKKKDVFIYS